MLTLYHMLGEGQTICGVQLLPLIFLTVYAIIPTAYSAPMPIITTILIRASNVVHANMKRITEYVDNVDRQAVLSRNA